MNTVSNFSTRLATNLMIIALLGLLVYFGSSIFVPLGFAIILAMLLLPVVKWLVSKGLPEILASIIAILAALTFVAAILFFFSAQVAGFMKDLPTIKEKLSQHWESLQNWVNETFHITRQKQDEAVQSAKENAQNNTGNMGAFVTGFASGVMTTILVPIYTFLILYYRKLIHKFLIDVFPSGQTKKVEGVLEESNKIVRSYMIGLLLEMLIVTILNAVGFMIIGIHYAIFLAVLAAVLNLVPYVGMLIAAVICMAVTLTSSDSASAIIWTGIILIVVQFIDNNFIMPYIVGSKVRINALVSLVGVVVGGLLAGVSGMFLSIPVMAIMKAVFDRVDDLRPWGTLLGDEARNGKAKK